MSGNEDLVKQVQCGDRDALPILWEQVHRLAYRIAGRYLALAQRNGGLDIEDLHQCGYLALVEAVKTYKESKGAFSSWYMLYMRRACREALGLAGRERKEHYISTSLETPIAGADESLTLGDALADDTLLEPTKGLEMDDMCREVRQAVEQLPHDQGEMIRQSYFDGCTRVQVGEAMGIRVDQVNSLHRKGLMALRRNHRIQAYDPGYYRHKGVTAFNSSFTSVVEDAVLSKLDWQ